MSKIKVIAWNSADESKTFTDAIESFSYQVRNNDGAIFEASIPTAFATIILNEVSDFTLSLRKGDVISVGPNVPILDFKGLNYVFLVSEITNLALKGTCEIACIGGSLYQYNEVFGTLRIKGGNWEDVAEMYSLSEVEYHGSVKDYLVNVSKKADIVLGSAWNMDTLHHVVPKPFTSNTFTPASTQDTIAIFKDTKPTETDDYAPVYKVDMDAIINYEPESAQPPITHLTTMTLGTLSPQPDIGNITFKKYSATDISNNFKSYIIEEKRLGAVWVLSEADNLGNIESQKLIYSDGIEVDLGTTNEIHIIGIFEDSYVTLNADLSFPYGLTFRRYDRITKELLDEDYRPVANSADELWYETTARPYSMFKTNVLEASDKYPMQSKASVIWLKKALAIYGSSTTMLVGLSYIPEHTTNKFSVLIAPALTGMVMNDYFINSCKVLPRTDLGANANTVQLSAAYANATGTTLRVISLGIYDADLTAHYTLMAYANTGLLDTYDSVMPLDFVAMHQEVEFPNTAVVMWKAVLGLNTGIIVTHFNDASTLIEKGAYEGSDGQWVVKPDLIGIMENGLFAFDDEVALMLRLKESNWYLSADNAPFSEVIFQEGVVTDWLPSYIAKVLGRNAQVFVTQSATNDYQLFLQLSALPFISRSQGRSLVAKEISVGDKNVLALNFKIGTILMDIKYPNKGRVEIEVSSFQLRDADNINYTAFDVQQLNIPAIGAYCEVKFPGFDDYTLVKVTGVLLTYNGLVTEKISGIIME